MKNPRVEFRYLETLKPTDLASGFLGVETATNTWDHPLSGILALLEALQCHDEPSCSALKRCHTLLRTPPPSLHTCFRRLSRETNQIATQFYWLGEEIANLLVARRIDCVQFLNAQRLDTSSLAVLACCIQSQTAREIQWNLVLGDELGELANHDSREARRHTITRFIVQIGIPNIQGLEAAIARFARGAVRSTWGVDAEMNLRHMHHLSALCAYDAAIEAAWNANHYAQLETHTVQAFEMLGLLYLTQFEVEALVPIFKQWHAQVTQPRFIARWHYFHATTLAKRSVSPKDAEWIARTGIYTLGRGCDEDTQIERAWLLNALALCVSAQAIKYRDRQSILLRHALRLEQLAIAIIKDQVNNDAQYLRDNICTNLVTAHEMLGSYEQAYLEWQPLMQRTNLKSLLPEGHAWYRWGMLNWRSGRLTEAINALKCAAHAHADNPWLHTLILDALNFVQSNSFSQDMMSSVSKDLKVSTPRPKLPAFLPNIDLAYQPSRDFTSYLIGTR